MEAAQAMKSQALLPSVQGLESELGHGKEIIFPPQSYLKFTKTFLTSVAEQCLLVIKCR